MPTSSTKSDHERLRRYFLKFAPDDELDGIEDTYFATSDHEGLITDVENQLISDYVQRRLTVNEENAFERNYMVTDERREEVAFVKAIALSSSAETSALPLPNTNASPKEERAGVWKRFTDWLGAPGPILGLAAAVTTIILLLSNVVLLVKWRDQVHQTEEAVGQIPKSSTSRWNAAVLRAFGNAKLAPPVIPTRTFVIPTISIARPLVASGENKSLSFRLPVDPPDMIELPLELAQVSKGMVVDATLSAGNHTVWVEHPVALHLVGSNQHAALRVPFVSLKPYLGKSLDLQFVDQNHQSLGKFSLMFEAEQN